MPIIKTYEKNEATGELAKLYEKVIAIRGEVRKSTKLLGVSPELLKHHLEFMKYYMNNHPTLSQELLAAIRVLVSKKEKCNFCIDYNTSLLINNSGWTLEQVQDMSKDILKANLSLREIALLEITIKSIENAHKINKKDIDYLHKFEWKDRDILDAVNHAARMVALDIVFNTFKIGEYEI